MNEQILAFERACFDDASWKSVTLNENSIIVLEDYGYALGVRFGDECELLRIGVLPERRGGGLGSAILSAFLRQCEGGGAKRVFLEVACGNSAAMALYVKFGFTQIGRRRGYYGDDDAIVMEKHM
ncbi:MAG: GNAT family N-acetyltransferase [Oscillospiraceae bacterium]|nr:GNAT family N-acetyltransferase [Oscillospiraceae bacterium]